MYQKLVIIGYLGRDPEMRYTPNGQAVTSFSVATSRQWTGTGGEKLKETTWFRVSAWGKQAETCNTFLAKGSKVLVEGRLMPDPASGGPRTWKDRDGSVRANFEMTAEAVRFLSSRERGSDEVLQDETDDIPF
ncbi:MAG TPA: single-stranded DNA-binding protein [Bellilinea sp.]|nr:single-stranded DNA-binding protein [Bellilinea sp.]